MRMSALSAQHKVASHHQIEARLLAFNIRMSPGNGGLNGTIQAVLEDAEMNFACRFAQH